MKIPETEIKWSHIILLAILAAVLIFGFSLNKQVKQNKTNIQAIVNALIQSGVVKTTQQLPTQPAAEEPEKKGVPNGKQ